MVNTEIRLIIFFAAKDRETPKTWPGADCCSYHELLIVKFRLNLQKVGKTTRPFRYDLNQIPYDYTVEVSNRFKGLDLRDRMIAMTNLLTPLALINLNLWILNK